VLDHLCLDVLQGEILRLVGASGGGKSVLMHMTGGAAASPRKAVYDLGAADGFDAPLRSLEGPLVIPEPTAITRR